MIKNDFHSILEQMKIHGMNILPERTEICIPESNKVLTACFRYFLSHEGKEFTWQTEYDRIAEWLSGNHGRGLFLYGDCGRGKSLLCRYILPAILLKCMKKIVSVYDVQQMNKKLDEALGKNILALDDIGTEEIYMNYGNKRLAFAEIMDAAEKYGKLVIISTNLNRQQITERYGERIYDRIISTTERVEFKGQSLRR